MRRKIKRGWGGRRGREKERQTKRKTLGGMRAMDSHKPLQLSASLDSLFLALGIGGGWLSYSLSAATWTTVNCNRKNRNQEQIMFNKTPDILPPSCLNGCLRRYVSEARSSSPPSRPIQESGLLRRYKPTGVSNLWVNALFTERETCCKKLVIFILLDCIIMIQKLGAEIGWQKRKSMYKVHSTVQILES